MQLKIAGATALAAAAALAVTPDLAVAETLPGAGRSIEAARATWDTGWFHAEVYNKALEALGYEVSRPRSLTNPIFYTAVAQGDIDFWTNGWFPIHDTYRDDFEYGAELVGYVAKGGALNGYLIDKATADAHGITNLEDFQRPEIAALFDGDGDGKAELVACPPGWGCELTIEHQLDAYDLRTTVEPIKADYNAAMASALGRYQDGEPIFFYTWTPNWTVGILKPGVDVVWIEVPFPSLPPDQTDYMDLTTVPDVEGCVDNPCEMGWPVQDIRPVANSDFLAANPAARRLFEVITIPLADIFEQNAKMFRGEDRPEDIIGHAEGWIADNQALFDSWVAEAAAAAAE